jgi:UDP:flavonoid glycosyltransferase YjiC (YdhE family)
MASIQTFLAGAVKFPQFTVELIKFSGSYRPVNLSCLFVINGLGLGNSTRCHAVMEHLVQAGCRIDVLTSGNGLAYFQGKDSIASLNPMESFFYSGKDGGVSGWSTLKSIRRLLQIARTKRVQLEALVRQLKPDIAVIDSEYAIRPLRRQGIPIIGLNTSEMVVSQYLKTRNVPGDIRSHFWLVEFSDYLFHRHFCDLVLSPFPVRANSRHPKFRRIGLIARRAILDRVKGSETARFPLPRELRRVVFMLSGSVHASHIPFENHQLPFQVEIVGRSGTSRPNVTFHGRQMDNTELLAQADALVINGGYSAVSEAFVLRKPVFAVPVPGHAEQFVNARLVNEFGLGYVATEDNVLGQLLQMHQRNEWMGLRPMPATFEIQGAREAADAILWIARKPDQLLVSQPGATQVPGLSPAAR